MDLWKKSQIKSNKLIRGYIKNQNIDVLGLGQITGDGNLYESEDERQLLNVSELNTRHKEPKEGYILANLEKNSYVQDYPQIVKDTHSGQELHKVRVRPQIQKSFKERKDRNKIQFQDSESSMEYQDLSSESSETTVEVEKAKVSFLDAMMSKDAAPRYAQILNPLSESSETESFGSFDSQSNKPGGPLDLAAKSEVKLPDTERYHNKRKTVILDPTLITPNPEVVVSAKGLKKSKMVNFEKLSDVSGETNILEKQRRKIQAIKDRQSGKTPKNGKASPKKAKKKRKNSNAKKSKNDQDDEYKSDEFELEGFSEDGEFFDDEDRKQQALDDKKKEDKNKLKSCLKKFDMKSDSTKKINQQIRFSLDTNPGFLGIKIARKEAMERKRKSLVELKQKVKDASIKKSSISPTQQSEDRVAKYENSVSVSNESSIGDFTPNSGKSNLPHLKQFKSMPNLLNDMKLNPEKSVPLDVQEEPKSKFTFRKMEPKPFDPEEERRKLEERERYEKEQIMLMKKARIEVKKSAANFISNLMTQKQNERKKVVDDEIGDIGDMQSDITSVVSQISNELKYVNEQLENEDIQAVMHDELYQNQSPGHSLFITETILRPTLPEIKKVGKPGKISTQSPVLRPQKTENKFASLSPGTIRKSRRTALANHSYNAANIFKRKAGEFNERNEYNSLGARTHRQSMMERLGQEKSVLIKSQLGTLKSDIKENTFDTGIFAKLQTKKAISIDRIPDESQIFPTKVIPLRKRTMKKFLTNNGQKSAAVLSDQKVFEETRYRSFKLDRKSLKTFEMIKKFPDLGEADIIDVNSDSQQYAVFHQESQFLLKLLYRSIYFFQTRSSYIFFAFKLENQTNQTRLNTVLEELIGLIYTISIIILRQYRTCPEKVGVQNMKFIHEISEFINIKHENKLFKENLLILQHMNRFLIESDSVYTIFSKYSANPTPLNKDHRTVLKHCFVRCRYLLNQLNQETTKLVAVFQANKERELNRLKNKLALNRSRARYISPQDEFLLLKRYTRHPELFGEQFDLIIQRIIGVNIHTGQQMSVEVEAPPERERNQFVQKVLEKVGNTGEFTFNDRKLDEEPVQMEKYFSRKQTLPFQKEVDRALQIGVKNCKDEIAEEIRLTQFQMEREEKEFFFKKKNKYD